MPEKPDNMSAMNAMRRTLELQVQAEMKARAKREGVAYAKSVKIGEQEIGPGICDLSNVSPLSPAQIRQVYGLLDLPEQARKECEPESRREPTPYVTVGERVEIEAKSNPCANCSSTEGMDDPDTDLCQRCRTDEEYYARWRKRLHYSDYVKEQGDAAKYTK